MAEHRLDFLDVSHWQSDRGTIDWNKAKADGVLGVIIKATEGTSYKDPGFTKNRDGALAAGLAVSTYHFLKAGNADGQMRHYVNTVKPKKGERLVIDYEDAQCRYSDLAMAVETLRQEAPECEISVYGSAKLTDDVRGAGSQASIDLTNTSAWMARYSTKEPDVAKNAWLSWSAWQYSDAGKVAGVEGAVDLNVFNGSRENCVQWIGPPTGVPVPTPEPQPQPDGSVVALAFPAGTDVTVSVNGAVVWAGKAGESGVPTG